LGVDADGLAIHKDFGARRRNNGYFMTPKTDDRSYLAESPVPRVFTDVGKLLSNPAAWGEWLSGHPDRAEHFAAAYRGMILIASHTGWETDVVLDQLGCATKTEEALADLDEDQLSRCTAYMTWVESLLGDLDLELDKRLTVAGATRFFAAASQDLDICERIMDDGEFPPLEYLRLGEIAETWESALRQLDGPDGDLARQVAGDNPFIDAQTPHMSLSRLDMLGEPDAEQMLGPRVQARMDQHLSACPVCEGAARDGADDHETRETAAA
jgi:hypothetical protein